MITPKEGPIGEVGRREIVRPVIKIVAGLANSHCSRFRQKCRLRGPNEHECDGSLE
jgi:hypothetical protein